ncbi:MAG: TonB-dependent receptor, partial [Gammaproteobacteria bacterium]|nr:TonB-dependent receptor [Gammaproteobacteria bacterium]
IATRTGSITERNPGYGVVDLEFHYQPHRLTSLSLIGANLADKKYHSASENLWAPGRHVRIRFGVSL